jgi:hypothetical protein
MWKKRDMEIGRRVASIGVLSKPVGVRRNVKKSPCLDWFAQGSCPDWTFPSIHITFFFTWLAFLLNHKSSLTYAVILFWNLLYIYIYIHRLSKNIKIIIYKTIILPLVLYGCET